MSSHKDMGISFYMRETDKKGNFLEGSVAKDLEADFKGLLYSKADGIEKLGKLRVHTETYADSDRTRVYIPEKQTYEPTNVSFTFLFVGEDKERTYYSFLDYITKGFHAFWDTKRMRKVIFYVEDEISPATVINKGRTQYIELTLNVKNIFGKTFQVEQ